MDQLATSSGALPLRPTPMIVEPTLSPTTSHRSLQRVISMPRMVGATAELARIPTFAVMWSNVSSVSEQLPRTQSTWLSTFSNSGGADWLGSGWLNSHDPPTQPPSPYAHGSQ